MELEVTLAMEIEIEVEMETVMEDVLVGHRRRCVSSRSIIVTMTPMWGRWCDRRVVWGWMRCY